MLKIIYNTVKLTIISIFPSDYDNITYSDKKITFYDFGFPVKIYKFWTSTEAYSEDGAFCNYS